MSERSTHRFPPPWTIEQGGYKVKETPPCNGTRGDNALRSLMAFF
jgi:hypothetical protein